MRWSRRYAESMPRRQDDDPGWRPARRTGSASGALLLGVTSVVVATLAVFLTSNPTYLRVAVIVAAWAFVGAAFLAARRRSENQLALAREGDLRRTYERELDLEAAARQEFELELENRVRREAEDAVRTELAGLRAGLAALTSLHAEVAALARLREDVTALSALRGDVAALARLREDVAGLATLQRDVAELSALRHDVAALSSLRYDLADLGSLRHDVAELSALREDVAALSALREDVGRLGELSADVGRLRAQLREQFNEEMLVERIVMRTQASRTTAESASATPATREFGRVQQEPPTAALPAAPPAPELGRTPLDWLADRSLLDPPAPTRAQPAQPPRMAADPRRPVPYRRRRTDDEAAATSAGPAPLADPAGAPTTERPAVPPAAAPYGAAAYARDVPQRPEERAAEPAGAPEPPGHARLTEILAESGTTPPPGGRRRRRYRAEDEPDDVLARVLGGN